jgi:hypothetical protein
MNNNVYMMSGCKWQYGDWEPLTPQSWSSGSRQFQKDAAIRVEVLQSSLGSSVALDQCQTAGMLVGDSEEETKGLANWDINEVILAQSLMYLLIFAMKTFMLRNTWTSLNKELKELDNTQKESLSQEVRRVEKPGCCSKILGCFVKLETLCAKIQGPFFSTFIIFMPAYVLSPLLQATCHAGFIIAPAGDMWVIRWVGWALVGMCFWWFGCQILAQCSQRCRVISQFCNAISTLPLACLGGAILYYELLKLGKKGIGFEFVLFFKHMFSFSFTIGLEFSVDALQLLFSVTVFVDALAGFASTFTKRDWKEKCIFSYLVKNFKNVEPAQKQIETSV